MVYQVLSTGFREFIFICGRLSVHNVDTGYNVNVASVLFNLINIVCVFDWRIITIEQCSIIVFLIFINRQWVHPAQLIVSHTLQFI